MNISEKFNETSLLNKCRICLLKTGTWLIFTLYGKDEINIRTIYETCTGIKIVEDDNRPKALCVNCLNDLIATHSFIVKCKTADTALHSLETVLALEEPAGYKVLLIDKDEIIEFEYESKDEQHTEVEEKFIKNEHSEFQETNGFPEIVCNNENEVTTDNEPISNNEEVHSKLETPEVKFFENTINDVKEEYEGTGDKTEMNDNSLEQLCNVNDVDHQILKSINHNDNESKSQNRELLKQRPKNRICTICLRAFRRNDTLINHMRTHTQEKPFQCSVCFTKFSSSCNLARHARVHTGEKPYICDICGIAVTQSNNLKKHKEVHSGKALAKECIQQPKDILCSYCGLTFTNTVKFKRHLLNSPGHIEVENEDGRKKILKHFCKVCGRHFESKYKLGLHMGIHSGIKNHLCNYCGKKFYKKSTLNIHMYVHTGERPHKCEYCGKAFTQESALKFHTYIHTGARPFKCETCGKSFKQMSHLHYHVLLHTGQKNYSCTYCGKKFAQKGNLKQHMAVHTDETPYCCTYCNRGFKSSNNMRKHVKNHLKDKQVNLT